MTETTYDGAEERAVVTAMIVSDRVLARVAAVWGEGNHFDSRWSEQIGRMCVKYFQKHGRAPGKTISTVFASWADGRQDKETVKLAESFIQSLSDAYEARSDICSPEHDIELAAKHFNRVRIKRAASEALALVENGRVESAEEIIQGFRRVELGPTADVDVFHDEAVWAEALEAQQESIIKYDGAAGKFFGNALAKGSFISYFGPPKRGKTWLLLDTSWRAAEQRRRTLFLELGDMTQPQIMRRYMARAARRPLWARTVRHPKTMIVNKHDVDVTYEEETFTEKMKLSDVKEGFERLIAKKVRSNDPYLKLRCYPAGTVSVEQISNMVDELCQQGWVPDAVIMDYADLIAPPRGSDDFRHKTNAIWTGLRGVSTKGCTPLVVTATQANRASFTAGTLGMEHASEDMRKLAHVTGMVGINTRGDEKEKGVVRFNWTPLREDEFNQNQCVYVAQCLAIGNACVLSAFKEEEKEEDDDHEDKREERRESRNGTPASERQRQAG